MTTSPFLGISKSGNWCFSIGTENVTPSGLNSSVKREKTEGEEGRERGGERARRETEEGEKEGERRRKEKEGTAFIQA